MSHHDSTTTTTATTDASLSNETTSGASIIEVKSSQHLLLLVLLPATAILCVGIAVGLIVWALKRSRLDKLRHHLMPLYSFEQSDSSQDWETDLLSQEVRLRDATSQPSSPILKINTMLSQL